MSGPVNLALFQDLPPSTETLMLEAFLVPPIATPETTTFPDFALFKGDVIQDFTGISQQEGY